MRYFITTFIVLLAAPTWATTITSYPAVISHGSTMTLTGSGFGSRITGSSQTPIRYDDFETGTTAGHLIAVDLPWWTRQDVATQVAAISDENCRSGKCGKFVLETTPYGAGVRRDNVYNTNVGFRHTGKVFMDFWQYLDLVGNANGAAPSYQIKFVDISRGRNAIGSTVTPEWQFLHWIYGNPPNEGYYNISRVQDYLDGGGSLSVSTTRDAFKSTGWYHVKVMIDHGTVGVANGKVRFIVNGPGGAYYTTSTDNLLLVRSAPPEGFPAYPDYLRLGWTHESYAPVNPELQENWQTALYYDELYIDNSWAHVEICDSPVYASRTHCATQVLTQYTDTSVSATVNLDTFADASTVYAYVVNEEGEPSSPSGPITVSSEVQADIVPPNTTASPAAGTYTTPQSVTLTRNEAGTTYYSVNGEPPTTVYTGPITISTPTVLKWFSRDTAGNSEAVKTANYAITPLRPTINYGRINAWFRGVFK